MCSNTKPVTDLGEVTQMPFSSPPRPILNSHSYWPKAALCYGWPTTQSCQGCTPVLIKWQVSITPASAVKVTVFLVTTEPWSFNIPRAHFSHHLQRTKAGLCYGWPTTQTCTNPPQGTNFMQAMLPRQTMGNPTVCLIHKTAACAGGGIT